MKIIGYYLVRPVAPVSMADLKLTCADYAEVCAEVIPEGCVVIGLAQGDCLDALKEGLSEEFGKGFALPPEVEPFDVSRFPEVVRYATWEPPLWFYYRTPKRPPLPVIRLTERVMIDKRVW